MIQWIPGQDNQQALNALHKKMPQKLKTKQLLKMHSIYHLNSVQY